MSKNTEPVIPETYLHNEQKKFNLEQIFSTIQNNLFRLKEAKKEPVVLPCRLKTLYNPLGEECSLSLVGLSNDGLEIEINGNDNRWIASRRIIISLTGKGNDQTCVIESKVDTETSEQGSGIGGGLMSITNILYPKIIESLQLQSKRIVWLIKDEAKSASAKKSIQIDAERTNWSSQWAKLLGFERVNERNATESLRGLAQKYNYHEDIVWVRNHKRN